MASPTKKRATSKTKMTVDKDLRDYSNDPFFIKKREEAEKFLKRAGLPESFKTKK
ncbi:hypothetical protein [Flavihumibacter solisilvae]|uniref:hypothetical protein n=1 Tax=Flavihumibacter solisilvae TaxID=1349421 RepID=UPI0013648BBA|nr:hypothetical protein [Flavihumibacter solisilvae]